MTEKVSCARISLLGDKNMDVSKRNQIIIIAIFIILATIVTAIVINRDEIFKKSGDSILIYEEYGTISKDNKFQYMDVNAAIDFLKEGTGIIYFGFPECPWCRAYVPILEKKAEENNVDVIYYCNIREIRENNTKEYQELVGIIKDYLYEDDKGAKRVYVPDVYFVSKGQILGHNNDTSIISGGETEKYYTKEVRQELELKIDTLIKKVYKSGEKCNDNEKGC